MKNLKYILPIILLLYSCTDVKYGTVNFGDYFDIIYKQDFEDNTLGEYVESEWEEDWNYPEWSNRDISPEIIKNEDADNGTKVMRWHYPKGSVGPEEGGGQWITKLDSSYNEIYFSYRAKFKPEFKWVLGGKLNGVIARPFEGFDPPEWDEGCMLLLMWNRDSNITFYYYHQDQTHVYGNSKSWDYKIESGKWYIITIRAVLNTISNGEGNNDGILEGFINGKLVCQITNACFRNLETIKIDNLIVTSFFGGDGEEWAAQRDEWIDMDDFVLFTYKNTFNIPRGNIPSSPNTSIVLPNTYLKYHTWNNP